MGVRGDAASLALVARRTRAHPIPSPTHARAHAHTRARARAHTHMRAYTAAHTAVAVGIRWRQACGGSVCSPQRTMSMWLACDNHILSMWHSCENRVLSMWHACDKVWQIKSYRVICRLQLLSFGNAHDSTQTWDLCILQLLDIII